MKKNSPDYMKSSFESAFYGNDNYTTFERELKIEGKNEKEIRAAAPWIKGEVMP
jgi:hypothetical protein